MQQNSFEIYDNNFLDDGDEFEIEEAREMEIKEAFTNQLSKVNESDSLQIIVVFGKNVMMEIKMRMLIISASYVRFYSWSIRVGQSNK